VKAGPDGAVYIADWYDTRLSHMDPRDNWDKTRGRVYRIKLSGAAPRAEKFDLAKKTSLELVALLSHRQAWFRATALRLLGDRKDAAVIEKLTQLSLDPANPHAVDALWGLHAVGGFTSDTTASYLNHVQAPVRIWTLRLLGDRQQPIGGALKTALGKLAQTEPDAQVRSQLASTAKRLPGEVALPIILALMDRPDDVKDPHIPLLIWWALEHFTETHREQLIAAFSHASHWQSPLAKTHIIPRLAQRYASHPSPENQQMLAKLARGAPEGGRALLRKGVAEAFAGRGIGAFSPEMEAALFEGEARDFSDPMQMSLAIKRGDQGAVIGALGFIVREDAPLEADRVRVMQALADMRSDVAKPVFLEVLSRSPNAPVREAALAALGRYDDKELVMQLLRLWSGLDGAMRTRVLTLLVSRRSWTHELLSQVGHNGVISKADVPDEIARRARYWNDKEINAQLDRYFGKPPEVTASVEKQRRSDELIKVVSNGKAANALAGLGIFETRCAACHKLYGRGADTGPDLTGYERVNVANMLLSILDPSLTIREGYATFLITTRDDRSLVGFLEERSPTRLVLRDTVGQRTAIAISDIREERVIPTSLMPEGLLDGLSQEQLRDFFAYLTSATDPTGK
jgi:putative heme-binding domain-containing protein